MRNDRLHHTTSALPSARTPSARDRDRVLHCSAWRRLAAVTQVVDPSEGYLFHNRMTHSLKVAQIGRRLAEQLLANPLEACKAEAQGGLDPEVVEAAALAHDLGHPPFGHVAEKELDRLVKKEGCSEGYEGNAQSFRIVTRLAVRRVEETGLNLTRATLNAILKYPNLREVEGKQSKKWGAYRSEELEFNWAGGLAAPTRTRLPTLEAELMDRADDIAYAIHDLEDFYRAGLIPLELLTFSSSARERYIEQSYKHYKERIWDGDISTDDWQAAASVLDRLKLPDRYIGTNRQRAELRASLSKLIGKYVNSIHILEPRTDQTSRLEIPRENLNELAFLKELTWFYIIDDPRLATQQHGRVLIIRRLFKIYMESEGSELNTIFPFRAREMFEDENPPPLARIVADVISNLSDQQAVTLFRRLTGHSAGSLSDLLLQQ